MLNGVITLLVAVALVVAPASVYAAPAVDGAPVVEVIEDVDPAADTAAGGAVPAPPRRPLTVAPVRIADPSLAAALPPPVPPPER